LKEIEMVNETNFSSSWKIMQIGLVVRNMDASVKQLTALGFGPFIPKLLPPNSQSVGADGKPSHAEIDVMRSMIGNVELELCQPVSGESPHREYLATKGEGVQHILFQVPDLNEELKRLSEKGAIVILHVRFKGGGLAYVDLKSSGFVIELIQLPEDDPEILKILLSREDVSSYFENRYNLK
jgi:methylmalonyl-CoA/ethylmalonyl-CoA epimerase